MRRILYAIILSLLAVPAYAQQWDQVNGSMQVRSGPSTPLVIIDQTNATANSKILSLRAAGTEKCYIDIDGDLVCAGSFSFVNLTFTGQAIGPLDTDCSAPAYSGLGKLTTGIAVRTAPSVATCVGGALVDLTTATAKTMQSTFTFATTNGGITANRTSLGTTAGLGLAALNGTAAAAGAQQISPYVQWRGNGWKTDATAASRTVDFFADVLPVEGAAAPTGNWRLGYSINGAATTSALTISTAGLLTPSGPIVATQGTAAAPGVYSTGDPSTGLFGAGTGWATLFYGYAGTAKLGMSGAGSSFKVASDWTIGFNSGTDVNAGSPDTILSRLSAGVFTVSAGHAYGLDAAALIRTDPTIASGGCTSPAVTWANGTAAFLITIGTTCAGVKTVTLTLPAATNGWACDGDNHTSDAAQQTNYPVLRSTSTTAVVLTSYDRVTGLQEDFTDSNTYLVKCIGG